MCRVNVFCCGCSLRSGAVTAAVLTLIGVIASCIFAGILFSQAGKWDAQGYPTVARDVRISAIVYIVSAILGFIIFICLVLALRQGRAGFVMPWLICAMIQIVVMSINIILGAMAKNYFVIVLLAYVGFLIYLWIVVLNFYRELRDGGTGRQVGKV